MLFHLNQTDRVDGVGFKTTVQSDDLPARRDVVFRNPAKHRLHEPIVNRIANHLERNGPKPLLGSSVQLVFRVRNDDERRRIFNQLAQTHPVGRSFKKQDDRGRAGRFVKPNGLFDEQSELLGDTQITGHFNVVGIF